MSYGILTPGLVQEALQMVMPFIETTLVNRAKRQHLAIVVTGTHALVEYDPEKSFKDNCLVVTSIGLKIDWEHDYEEIALSKAMKSVRTGAPTSDIPPHYLLDEDTVFWGSDVLEDIVTACSGVEPYYDEMFSCWINAAIRALCKKKFAELPSGTEFIG
jgi:hypothetical protein